MNPQDLIDISKVLLNSGKGKPKQSFLRKALSSAYYAMFHTMSRNCADMLVGRSATDRNSEVWRHVYRGLEHGVAKNQCKSISNASFSQEIKDFANLFVTMQEKRHKADYDPFERFAKSATSFSIAEVELTISRFNKAPDRDKRAFAAHVLIKGR